MRRFCSFLHTFFARPAAALCIATCGITPEFVAAGQTSQPLAEAPPAATAPWTTEPLALPGTFTPAELRTTLRDDARDKELQILLRWPTACEQPLPLVVFSHGMGGDREAFGKLSEHWASHGFVVVHVTHSDSLKLRREQGEKVTRATARDVRQVDPADRLADVVFLAKQSEQLAKLMAAQAPQAPLTIDTDRIYVAGHSAGAMTTMLAINVKARLRTPDAAVRDMITRVPRGDAIFKGGIVISGQGTTNKSFGEDSWNALSVPMLVIAGSKDVAGVGNETPESRRHPFEKASGETGGFAPVWLLWIEGATHGSYQGKELTRLLREEPEVDVDMVTAATRASTLAFLLAAREGTIEKPQKPLVPAQATTSTSGEPASQTTPETLPQRAARLLRDPTWMPAMTNQQATLGVK